VSAKRIVVISGLAILITAAVITLDLLRPYWYLRLCNIYRDGIASVGRATPPNPNLVFLAIDAASANLDEHDVDELFNLTDGDTKEAHALRLMSKRFPWSREVYALVLEKLVQAGAQVVVFDLIFPGPSDDDAAFREALNRFQDHVVIGSNFVDGTLTRPSDTLVPQTSPIDHRVGFTNFWADDDEVVRRARYHVTFDQVRGTKANPKSEKFRSLAALALTKAGLSAKLPSDLDNHAFRFTAPPRQGYPAHSLFEIFVPSFWKQNYQSGQFFRNKIVIVGADGNWQHDDHPTPLGNMPGAELHLNAMNAAMHGEFLRELYPITRIACCIVAGLTAVLLSLGLKMPWIRFTMCLAVSGAGIWLGHFCFNHFSFYLPMVAPVTAMNAAMLFALVYDFTSEHLEKARLRRTLERYVSRDVVRELVDRPEKYGETLGGVVRPAAILFSDIRSYSAVTVQNKPHTLVAQLNEYFSAMVDCVFECDGTLDKFIGDALLAVWGTLHSRGAQQDAIAAVQSALLMQQKLTELNTAWRARGWTELRVGVGINHGEVVVGNIGSPQRMEFTVIGDAVNQSWRLQEMTKQHGTNIILSSSVALLVADHFQLRPLSISQGGAIRGAYQISEAPAQIAGPALPLNSLPQPETILTSE